jgi:hypothetical protein
VLELILGLVGFIAVLLTYWFAYWIMGSQPRERFRPELRSGFWGRVAGSSLPGMLFWQKRKPPEAAPDDAPERPAGEDEEVWP